jgi:hypothetical protein
MIISISSSISSHNFSSSVLKLKKCVMNLMFLLSRYNENIKAIVYTSRIFNYFKPILLSLCEDLKKMLENSDQETSKANEIKTTISCENVLDKYKYFFSIHDLSHIPAENYGCSLTTETFWDTHLPMMWSRFPLCHIETVNFLFLMIRSLESEINFFDSSCIDLMNEIVIFFNIQKRLIKTPHFISFIEDFNVVGRFLFNSVYAAVSMLVSNENVLLLGNKEKLSILMSLIEYSTFLVENSVVRKIYYLNCLCEILFKIVNITLKMPDEYRELIKSDFEISVLTELLIYVFYVLNSSSSSSSPSSALEQLPSTLSFLSSISPSDEDKKAKIVDYSARIVKMLLGSSAPVEIINYLELTSFTD